MSKDCVPLWILKTVSSLPLKIQLNPVNSKLQGKEKKVWISWGLNEPVQHKTSPNMCWLAFIVRWKWQMVTRSYERWPTFCDLQQRFLSAFSNLYLLLMMALLSFPKGQLLCLLIAFNLTTFYNKLRGTLISEDKMEAQVKANFSVLFWK